MCAPVCVMQRERERSRQLICPVGLASAERMMLVVQLIYIWGVTAYNVEADESTQSTVLRTNYGVVFRHRATVSPKVDFWGHTYEIPIPSLTKWRQVMDYCNEEPPSNPTHCQNISSIGPLVIDFMNSTHRELKAKIQAAYDLIPELSHAPSIAKKKRSLLPFVGGVMSSLFGTASEADINLLKRQILQLYNSSVGVQNVLNHDNQRLSSFMSLTQENFNNLEDLVQKGFSALSHDLFRQSLLRADFNAQILRIFAIVFQKFSEYSRLHDAITQILQGLEILKMGSLPANLFTAEILTATLDEIDIELKSRFPTFRILHRDAGYYYKHADFVCTRFRNKVYVNVKFPISDISSAVRIYDVIKYPLAFPDNSSFLNELTSVSQFFVISNNRDFYIESDYIAWPVETFKMEIVRPVSQASCLLALYLDNSLLIHQLCKYIVFVDDRKPKLFVLDYPLILIRHVSAFIMNCPSRRLEQQGCEYCLFPIPCGCAIESIHAVIPARISSCERNAHNMSVTPLLQYNYNMPLLMHFFDNQSLDLLSRQELLQAPLSVQLPAFRLFTHSLPERLATSHRLNLAMEKIVNATKSDQLILATALDPVLSGDIDFLGNYFQSVPGYITLASAILSSVSFLGMLWLLYKVHIIFGTLTLLSSRKVLSAPLSLKPFVYVNPTSTYSPVISQEHFQSANLFLIFIIAVGILYFLYKSCVWRRSQPIVKSGCDLVLHVTQANADVCISISLQMLPLCPTHYSVRSLHTALSMRITGFCRPHLIITASPFDIVHTTTMTSVDLCSDIPISLFTLWKLRSLMQKNYNLFLFLQHGGMIYYSKKLRAGNCLI